MMNPSGGQMLYAYMAASAALDVDPPSMVVAELCRLTVSARDLIDAVRAMRDAAQHDRVTAALRLLRARRAEEEKTHG